MIILSHRGYWRTAAEKNTSAAFERSFSLGFGTETDLRDCSRQLVIAHDPPGPDALPAAAFLAMHARWAQKQRLPLALNVKADGLQDLLLGVVGSAMPADAFVFDMSIPDTLHWLRRGVPVFVRHSDVEPEPVLYAPAAGVWLDAFHDDWWDAAVVQRHLDAGKRVCVVSPELHRREPRRAWDRLAALSSAPGLMLCTDEPELAMEALGHAD